MKLIFATNNLHKLEEIRFIIRSQLEIISLKEAGINQEIPEPYDSFRDNALEKSRAIYLLSDGKDCFSEDTGLEVDALNGEPGVKSARYAGEPVSFPENIKKLMAKLGNSTNRRARFRTVISLILDNKEYFFEGICEGDILPVKKGSLGFGYDPIFIPKGAAKSFGEMTLKEKNRYSHRKKAVRKMMRFLRENNKLPEKENIPPIEESKPSNTDPSCPE